LPPSIQAQQLANDPLVSVVIPAYRCAQFITQALNSVLSQTVMDFEIIVVNDGSPDTADLEAALMPFVEKVRYFKQSTKGPSAARNTGIRNAHGKYVAFLDGDDYWMPEHLAKGIAVLEREPELVLVYCDCILIRNGEPYSRVFSLGGQSARVTFESLLIQSSTPSTSSVLASREALLAVGGFDEGLSRCEDFDLWLRLSFAGGRMAYHSEAEVFHRIHDKSLSANGAAMLRDRIRVYEKVSRLSLTPRQQEITREMIRKTEGDAYVEQVKESLDRGDLEEAREAALRADAIGTNWKIKVAMIGLRVAPRMFLMLDRCRSRLLGKLEASRGGNMHLVNSGEVPREEPSHKTLSQDAS
jgi:GT2 family glycosyltransferase